MKTRRTEVIELTDSDDEPVLVTRRPTKSKAGPSKSTASKGTRFAGPSHSRALIPVQINPLGPSKTPSLENIAPQDNKRSANQKPVVNTLFIPSDEENTPPSPESTNRSQNPPDTPDAPHEIPVVPNVDEELSDPRDLGSTILAQVLEIVPDVEINHVTALVDRLLPEKGENTLETILHALFEDASYPKIDKKGKRKQGEHGSESGSSGSSKRTKIDYASNDRVYSGGIHYAELTMNHLLADFPLVPKNFVSRILHRHRMLYAPTHQALLLEAKKPDGQRDFVAMRAPRKPSNGKDRILEDEEFTREREWLLTELEGQNFEKLAAENDDNACAEGLGIECGCCFSEYAFESMVQCPDAHLFCKTCMLQYAETLLGSHDHRIICMDQDGCKLPFSYSELSRLLTPKLLSLYERVKQGKEIEMAELEGLEECPFCEYKCVIENPQERLFRCGNEETCGAVTCRQCKKIDHLPRTCQEVDDDKKLDAKHAVEEAMTRALMRNCPKCQKAFIKDAGCNKMSCPNCGTLSCYVCRKQVTSYEHFNQTPPGVPAAPTAGSSAQKCPLWENLEIRHAQDVNEAAQEAQRQYLKDHPELEEEDLHVDLAAVPAQPGIHGGVHPAQHALHQAVDPGFLGHHLYPANHRQGQAQADAYAQIAQHQLQLARQQIEQARALLAAPRRPRAPQRRRRRQ